MGIEAMAGVASDWKSSVDAVNSGLSALGISSSAISTGAALTSVTVGTVSMARAALSVMTALRARKAAEAAALIAAHSWNPAGWARIAMAAALSASVAVLVDETLKKTIRKDLSTASGRQAAAREAVS